MMGKSPLLPKRRPGRLAPWLAGWLLAILVAPALTASAQELSDEMLGIFHELLPLLDEDLQVKVQEAIDKRQDYLELTVDQFRRFRDHPDNPFDGWQDFDPDSLQGLIRLEFETQPIRDRVPHALERQHPRLLQGLSPVIRRVNAGTVRIFDGSRQVALGMVVSPEGHILTKWSEVEGVVSPVCRAADGRVFAATPVTRNQANDVALLKIEAGALPPVVWSDQQPRAGAFVITPHAARLPLAMGVYSNPPRSLVNRNQAWLGVRPANHPSGVRVLEVTADSAAEQAGLLANDILVTIDGRPVSDVQSLVNEIRQHAAGDQLRIEYLRDGQSLDVTVTLAGRNVGGPSADRFDQMETFGAIQSRRRDGFPLVFQHDTPLVPEQCGGPVTNLRGEVVGMNIARGGRVASYAIPSGHLQQLLGELLRPNVASSDVD